MPTLASTLLTDIDLRYRNSFTVGQKCVWMNDEQNDIFTQFKIDIGPVNFPLITGVYFYSLPSTIEYVEQIRAATIQINDDEDNPVFIPLPYRRNGVGVLGDLDYWYTLNGQGSVYINIPAIDVDDRQVYFYLDGAADPIVDGNSPVSVPTKYLEILKLGTLTRIAAARKDIVMRNNFDLERQEKIADMVWTTYTNQPEFVRPVNTLPVRGRFGSRGYITNGW